MKKLKTLVLLILSLSIVGSTPLVFEANEKNTLSEMFPNESLRSLIASQIGVTEDAEVEVEQLLEIKEIDLNSSIQISSFEELSPLKNLEDIMLRWQEDVTSFDGVENFPNLTSLYVIYSPIKSLEGLEALTKLESLIISNPSAEIVNVGNEVLKPIQYLPLTRLQLSNFGLTDEKMVYLNEMTTLDTIVLNTSREVDYDLPEEDWVTSTESALANKLTNFDFAKNLSNLRSISATDNQFENFDGLTGHENKLTILNVNTPHFGEPFSKTTAVEDLSNLYVSDNSNNLGLNLVPMLTLYINKEAKLDLEKNEFYIELPNLKPINIFKADGSVEAATIKIDENVIPITFIENEKGYRASWKVEDSLEYLGRDGWKRLFEVDMFDKDQRHVTFMYSVSLPKTEVIVKYVDENNNELINSDSFIDKYKLGEQYELLPKNIKNFKVKTIPSSAKGVLTDNILEVIFVYERSSAGNVFVNHVDTEGNLLADELILDGSNKLGLDYTTSEIDIENFKLSITMGEPVGTFKVEDQLVTYIYERMNAGNVYINHLDKDGNKLLEEEVIDGTNKLGLEYLTSEESIPNYKLIETPNNATGIFKDEDQYVTYVYETQKLGLPDETDETEKNPPTKEETMNNSKEDSTKKLVTTGDSYRTEFLGVLLLLIGFILVRKTI